MIWVLIAIVIVLLVVIGTLVARQQRSHQLQQGFGPEYDRVVAERGDQRAGEQELLERRQRLDQFQIRALEPTARKEYLQRWNAAQRRFVDQPGAAVGEAQRLVQQVMHDRGYPVDSDFEQRAADISVEHPDVVENYRAAHSISVRARSRDASTEQLRQAMVHYRALVDDLLAPSDAAHTGDSDQSNIANETTRSR